MSAVRTEGRRGQGTLEYVLVFAVLVIILLVVGFVFRKQVQNAAKDVAAKLEQWQKDPSSTKPAQPTPGATGSASGADAKGAKGAKGGLEVQKKETAAPEPEEPQFSWKNLGIAKQMMVVAAGVGITMGIFLFFRQAKR